MHIGRTRLMSMKFYLIVLEDNGQVNMKVLTFLKCGKSENF